MFNKGVGPNSYAPTETVSPDMVPENFRAFSVFDLNHDSRKDIVVSFPDPLISSGYLALQLFRGQVDGSFLPYVTSAPAPGYGFGTLMASVIASQPMATGDFDGDGFPDLFGTTNIASLYADFYWLVLKSSGGADFRVQLSSGIAGLRGVPFVSPPVDLNGDGKLDIVARALVMAGNMPGWVAVSLGNGNGLFVGSAQKVTGTDGATAVSISDANSDAKPDLIVTLPAGATTFYNDGAANFSTTPPPAP